MPYNQYSGHKDYRKQGIASKLVLELLKLCKKHECTYITLEVRAGNMPAQNLYSKFGFLKEAKRKDYYRNPDGSHEDALIMSKGI
jgi:ribosomal-protein-alanine N-acetyltransferase